MWCVWRGAGSDSSSRPKTARALALSLARALSMYIYIQEAVFFRTEEDRTARSLSLHLSIHHIHHPEIYAYVRALGKMTT